MVKGWKILKRWKNIDGWKTHLFSWEQNKITENVVYKFIMGMYHEFLLLFGLIFFFSFSFSFFFSFFSFFLFLLEYENHWVLLGFYRGYIYIYIFFFLESEEKDIYIYIFFIHDPGSLFASFRWSYILPFLHNLE